MDPFEKIPKGRLGIWIFKESILIVFGFLESILIVLTLNQKTCFSLGLVRFFPHFYIDRN